MVEKPPSLKAVPPLTEVLCFHFTALEMEGVPRLSSGAGHPVHGPKVVELVLLHVPKMQRSARLEGCRFSDH